MTCLVLGSSVGRVMKMGRRRRLHWRLIKIWGEKVSVESTSLPLLPKHFGKRLDTLFYQHHSHIILHTPPKKYFYDLFILFSEQHEGAATVKS